MRGEETQEADPTLKRAIEIKNRIIQNPAILKFQNRAEAYPHSILE